MRKLNKLTKNLLSQGYTKENPPDYVKPWNDFYGGFEYKNEYLNQMVFETGCGLLVKGSHFNGGYMSWGGIDWNPENDNPIINCPHRKIGCGKNHPFLANKEIGGTTTLVQCACHQVHIPYEYEKSIDKIYDDKEKRKNELFKSFLESKNGRVCEFQSRFNEREDKWIFSYDPIVCARTYCHYCNVLGKELDKKKGNVFYDVKTTRIEKGKGFIPDEKVSTIIKGKRLLDKNCSMDICRNIVKMKQQEIIERELMRHHSELFFKEYHGVFFELEVMNIRAETRNTRDLEQDLRDISDGIKIVHESDLKKSDAEKKRQRVNDGIEARKKKYLKMIERKGVDHLDAADKRRIMKMVDKGIIYSYEVDEANERHENDVGIRQIGMDEMSTTHDLI